jgi:hypothetical protein
MNAYTTMGQARIQPRDVSALLRANGLAGASLARLEWQRGCQAEVEVTRQLKHNGVTPRASGSIISLLRQTIGAGLVRAGERLAGVPRGGVAPDLVPAVDTLGMAS